MAGIVFLGTRDLEKMLEFYGGQIGMDLWLRQSDCAVLKHQNLLLGFCERERLDASGIITLFYDRAGDVDEMYARLKSRATGQPETITKYGIYRFFARDPEGRTIEFQSFQHPLEPFLDGESLLLTRRSTRAFRDQPVTDEILWKVFETCRYAPTARNAESYSFTVIRDRDLLEWLGGLRGGSSAPIARAGTAVAISASPKTSRRYQQDGDIAAYHLLLAAWLRGLGTCWIAAMDRDDVKRRLQIPQDHYLATITPVGYPAEPSPPPRRRPASSMVRFIEASSPGGV